MIGDKLVIKKEHLKSGRHIAELLYPMIMKTKGRFIVTIAGESGSGKSELATTITQALLEKGLRSKIIQQDDYFVYPPKTNEKMRREDMDRVGLFEVNLAVLDQSLCDIIAGKRRIAKPLVIFEDDCITKETLVLDKIKVVIVEGTYTSNLKNVHCHVFIDRTYLDTREARQQRSREKQDEFLEKVLEIEHKIISSHKPLAAIVVTKGYEVVNESSSKQQTMNTTRTLFQTSQTSM